MTSPSTRLLLFIVIYALFPCPVAAQEIPDDFHLPEITSVVLPNGLRVMHASLNNVPTVEISFIVKAGADQEPHTKQGVAQAVNQLLRSGTQNREKGELDELWALLAVEVSTYTHYDYSQLYGKGLTRNFRSMFEAMSEMFTRPAFPEAQLGALQGAVPVEATSEVRSVAENVSAALLQDLCGRHSAVSTSLPSRLRGIADLNIEDVRSFYAEQYLPEQTIVLVVGDVDASFVRTVATEFLASWRPGAAIKRAGQSNPQSWAPNRISVVSDSGARICQYRIGLPALSRGDERFAAQLVLNQLLGGSAEARLYNQLWQQERISPNVSSSIGFSSGCSYLAIAGSVPAGKADTLLVRVSSALESLRNGDFSEADVRAVSARLARQYAYEFTSNAGALGVMKELALYAPEGESFASFLAQLLSCTRSGVIEVAHEVLRTDRMRIVMSGDVATLEETLARETLDVVE